MSESLRNDGRIWVPKKKEDAIKLQKGEIKGSDIPEEDRDYYLERRYPAFGNLVPRDVASRAAKERCDAGFGVNNTGLAVFLDFSEAINRLGIDVVLQRYGNLFDMYEEITDVNPGELAKEISGVKYYNPMMIYPAIHYTMGGIWVDYELQTTIKGLFAIGECNFSDHGANRLGASIDARSGRRLLRIALHYPELSGRSDYCSSFLYRSSRICRSRKGCSS